VRATRGKAVSDLGVAVLAIAGCGSTAPAARPSASPAIPSALVSEARPIGTGPRFNLPVTGQVSGSCEPVLGGT
jgi:hypothetical protein